MQTETDLNNKDCFAEEKQSLTKQKLDQSYRSLWSGNDRFFAVALVLQWAFLIGQALVISPRTWIGEESTTHAHVWAAVILGGVICLPAAWIGWTQRGRAIARISMTIAQALVVSLLIHFGGGRIEWHFSVFVMLAVLAMYRDPWVLLTATVVVAADHGFRGLFWPESIYGYVGAGRWLWVEHAAWVVVEVALLMAGVRRSAKEMRTIAEREAEIELVGKVGIARSVDGMIQDIHAIESTGDLTGRVDARFDGVTKDLAVAINGFIGTLRGIIEDVRDAAQAASSSSLTISAGSEEMAQTAETMMNRAREIASAASDANDVAERGSTVIGQTIQSLERIGTNVQEGGQLVGALDAKNQHIGSLVTLIQEIADQTNLLALNAAIESARAGEHGRGFAVVADEVRKLADRTASVTDEIQQAIQQIESDTRSACRQMEENSRKAEECIEQSATAGEIIARMLSSSRGVSQSVQTLSAGFGEVGEASANMSRSVTELADRNENLKQLTDKFKTA
ncbi:MAG: methyl-accepting chemotaxis protein [Planctomycetota bacterium]